MNILIILVAILPGLLISYFIYRIDQYDKEPKFVLAICFLLGMLSTFPLLKFESWADELNIIPSEGFIALMILSFVVVGFGEELIKFLCFILYPFQEKVFNEPLDGIVYSLMIGMGFATLENMLYAEQFGLPTTLFRAFTAVPAHGVFAVITGYYAGLAKFDQENRYVLLAKGFGLAVLIHGAYDFFILQEYHDSLTIGALLILFVGIYFSIQMIQQHREASLTFTTSATPPHNDFAEEVINEMQSDISQEEE